MAVELNRSEKRGEAFSDFEVCRRAADSYLNSGKALSITAQELYENIARGIFMASSAMRYYDPMERTQGPFIVDLRSPESELHELYYNGHIPGSVNIPWRQLTRMKYLVSLPQDRKIVVYSNNGQTGAQASAILNVLGYDAINIKWGMTAWTKDASAAPERFDRKRDVIWQNSLYRSTITADSQPEDIYPLPDRLQTTGENAYAVLWNGADNYLRDFRPANVSAAALYDPLFAQIGRLPAQSPWDDDEENLLVLPFGALPALESDEPFSWPFILDVRSTERYNSGHIPGCLHVPYKEVFERENLKKLPPERQIVVCSDTGHTAACIAALLNILGYDAVNLKWGMSGWAMSSIDGTEPERYSDESDGMDYPIVKGWNAGQALRCKT